MSGYALMPPAQAAWVREHAWTPAMRRLHDDDGNRDLYAIRACQWGMCRWCARAEHGRCDPPYPACETIICRPGGTVFAVLPAPYQHLTAVGDRCYASAYAFVHLTGRMCRWVCACDCEAALAGVIA